MKRILFIGLFLCCLFLLPSRAFGSEIPWGVHLLEPTELPLLMPHQNETGPRFVTVPMALSDRRKEVWETFFEDAFKAGITPMVRWVTRYSDGVWHVPTRKEITDATAFLSSLTWPGRRIVILFNEPNHAKEWGGSVDPENYASIATFAAYWLKSESNGFEVLPAGLDAAAPNNKTMMENLRFISLMYEHRPELFDLIDGWTSHSYPNPDFSSSPYRRTKDSLWGFDWELRRIKSLSGKDFPVYITETGWKQSPLVNRWISRYYQHAATTIWSDPRVKAVTVFLLRGFNGPFSEFSLTDKDGNQAPHFKALLDAVK